MYVLYVLCIEVCQRDSMERLGMQEESRKWTGQWGGWREVDEDTERFCKKMLEAWELDASDKGGIVPRAIIDNGL